MDRDKKTPGASSVWLLPQWDPRRCVILVPFSTHIVPGCEQSLIGLQRRGYEVWRVGGFSAIDLARSELATKALAEGFDETFWIDSDIEFDPTAVDRVRSHGLPICAGIYARKGARAIVAHTLPGTTQLGMGRGSGLVELLYAGTGFLHVRREVYLSIQQKLALPLCNAQFGRAMVPFFMPMIVRDNRSQELGVRSQKAVPSPPAPLPKGEGRQEREKGSGDTSSTRKRVESQGANESGGKPPQSKACWYLSEDYSFCERARQCGYKIMADTSIRLWHIGDYRYGWEDAGQDRPRHDSFLFLMNDGEKK
jgi:hypothetical protein